jgi:outer membrane protein assembly factor BamA
MKSAQQHVAQDAFLNISPARGLRRRPFWGLIRGVLLMLCGGVWGPPAAIAQPGDARSTAKPGVADQTAKKQSTRKARPGPPGRARPAARHAAEGAAKPERKKGAVSASADALSANDSEKEKKAGSKKKEEKWGPSYVIESIKIKGNKKTAASVIKRQLGFKAGNVIHANDERVLAAKFRLLGLGYFRSVNLYLRKGSRKGRVHLIVEVTERGTIWIDSIFFGSSEATDFWGGLDVSERNFLGLGIVLSGAFVVGSKADVPNSRLQHAEQLRFSNRYFLGSRFGLSLTVLHADASEFFRVTGKDHTATPGNFIGARYRRYGGTVGTSMDIGKWNRLGLHYRWEGVESDLPLGKVRVYPDGTTAGIDYHLDPGQSYISSLVATFTRDKRNDPVVPTDGYRVDVTGEIASAIMGSSYSYAKLVGRVQKWWELPGPRHSISLHLLGGMIVGRAPLFSKFFVGDVNALLPRRALDLNFSTLPSRNLFRTNADTMRYEDAVVKAACEYSLTVFSRKSLVYRGSLFVRAGVFALFSREDLRQRESSLANAIPIDMSLDVGIRFDTHIGIFTVSVANALGRLPF